MKNKFVVVSLLLCSTALQAEIYQWRDEQGRIHYSDKKPRQQPARDVSATVEATNIDDSSAEREKLGRLFKQETAAEKRLHLQQQQEQQRSQQAHAQQCQEALRYLEVLRGPVYFTREDGSSYTISEAEREQKAAQMASWLQLHCPQ